MLIEKLDRTHWRLSQAIDHIANNIQQMIGRNELTIAPVAGVPPWQQAADPRAAAINQAARESQIALRDGDLHAQGRLSTTQSRPWNHSSDGWDLHSGHHSTMALWQCQCGQWRADYGRWPVHRYPRSALHGARDLARR